MDNSSSIRSSRRARAEADREDGFALVSALIIAFLFFSLVGLLMIESTAVLRAAQHFRARLVAQNLAESGAELAARSMAIGGSGSIDTEVDDGTISGSYATVPTPDPSVVSFTLTGTGRTSGADPTTAVVKVYGTYNGSSITIQQTEHTQ